MKTPEAPHDPQAQWGAQWVAYCRTIEELAHLVHTSGWQFDHLVCLARGGLLIGDVFSLIFQKPLSILATSAYRDAVETDLAASGVALRKSSLSIAQHLTSIHGEPVGNVLVVDDLVDSGATLARVCRHLPQQYPQVRAIKSAVLWWKQSAAFQPDFHVEYVADNRWIHQPFEVYDAIRPEQLAARLQE